MEITIKLNYIVIAITTLLVSVLGRIYASSGMRWYYTLTLPSFTPPSWAFGAVWSIIFVTSAAALMLVWNRFERDKKFWLIIALFIMNAVLNVLWTYLFFRRQLIGFAFIDALLLFFNVLALIVLVGQRSLSVAGLLAPYLAWLTFELFLQAAVWFLN